jgi:transcriptional regulator GlxA family with amidase domain
MAEALEDLSKTLGAFTAPEGQGMIGRMRDDSLVPTLARLIELLIDEPRPEVQACLLEALLSSALRAGRAAAAPRRSAPLLDAVVERALKLMRADVKRRWTVRELAAKVGVSRAVFARRFVRALGEPPQRWLTRLRLERAAALLEQSDDALAAVAVRVGYDSEFAFSRAFRRQFGVAPGVYRRRLRTGSGAPILLAA